MSKELGIACAWCGQLLDDTGMEAFDEGMSGCETCDGWSDIVVEIRCTNPKCPKYKKVIYKKEGM